MNNFLLGVLGIVCGWLVAKLIGLVVESRQIVIKPPPMIASYDKDGAPLYLAGNYQELIKHPGWWCKEQEEQCNGQQCKCWDIEQAKRRAALDHGI